MKKKTVIKPNRKPQTWITTALLAAIAVAYVVFLFLPGQRSISQLRALVQERRQQILQAQTLLSTVSMARNRLAETHDVGQKWRADAPGTSDLIAHFASLTHEAEAAGVAIDRLDPLPAVDLHLVSQQNVSLQFHASFPSLFDFLKRVEALPGTIWVRKLRLHGDASPSNLPRGELTMTIFVDRAD
jgi:Tfp pilus assembly protein PilO